MSSFKFIANMGLALEVQESDTVSSTSPSSLVYETGYLLDKFLMSLGLFVNKVKGRLCCATINVLCIFEPL